MPHGPTLPYSLNENMEPIQQDGMFLELHKAAAFSANLEPLATLLKKFQRDNESPNTDVDKRAAALRMVNPSLELKQQMLQAIEVGGGHSVLKPTILCQSPAIPSNPDPVFKATKNMIELFPLLHVPKQNTALRQQQQSVKHLVAALQGHAPPASHAPEAPQIAEQVPVP